VVSGEELTGITNWETAGMRHGPHFGSFR